jgi:hypothetical protein
VISACNAEIVPRLVLSGAQRCIEVWKPDQYRIPFSGLNDGLGLIVARISSDFCMKCRNSTETCTEWRAALYRSMDAI